MVPLRKGSIIKKCFKTATLTYWDGLSLDFISTASVISNDLDRKRNINVGGQLNWFTIVQSLQFLNYKVGSFFSKFFARINYNFSLENIRASRLNKRSVFSIFIKNKFKIKIKNTEPQTGEKHRASSRNLLFFFL